MGNLCLQVNFNTIDELLVTPDLVFESFSSRSDQYFDSEKIMNILSNLSLPEFFQAIYSFPSESNSNKAFLSKVEVTKLPIYLKNKILRSPQISNSNKISEADSDKFSMIIFPIFKYAYENYKSAYKQIYDKKLKEENKSLPKLCILQLGFLYCGQTTNQLKLALLFNLFSDEGKLSKSSQDLYMFLFFMILYPSNILLLTINELASEDPALRSKMSEEKFQLVYDDFQIKDATVICKQLIELIFENNTMLDYDAFEKSMISKKLYWILNPSGIRSQFDILADQQKK